MLLVLLGLLEKIEKICHVDIRLNRFLKAEYKEIIV